MKLPILLFCILAGCSNFSPMSSATSPSTSAVTPPTNATVTITPATATPTATPNTNTEDDFTNLQMETMYSTQEYITVPVHGGDTYYWRNYLGSVNTAAQPSLQISFLVTGSDGANAKVMEIVNATSGLTMAGATCFASATFSSCSIGIDFHVYETLQASCPGIGGSGNLPPAFWQEVPPGEYWIRVTYNDGSQKKAAVNFAQQFPNCTTTVVTPPVASKDSSKERAPANAPEERSPFIELILIAGAVLIAILGIYRFWKFWKSIQ